MRKSTLAVLAACVALVAAMALPAAASARTFRTTVSINFVDRPGPDIFRGRVTSPNNNCIEDRLVRLFRVRDGNDQRIDFDESEDDGRWDIDVEGDPQPGRLLRAHPARPARRRHLRRRDLADDPGRRLTAQRPPAGAPRGSSPLGGAAEHRASTSSRIAGGTRRSLSRGRVGAARKSRNLRRNWCVLAPDRRRAVGKAPRMRTLVEEGSAEGPRRDAGGPAQASRGRNRRSRAWSSQGSRMKPVSAPTRTPLGRGAQADWRERSGRLFAEFAPQAKAMVRRAFRGAFSPDELDDQRPALR